MNYWLMKSEPDAFSIDDLAARPNKVEPWDGIRNYQARNFMRDDMKRGDLIFFYHSRMFVAGKPSLKAERLINVTHDALMLGIDQVAAAWHSGHHEGLEKRLSGRDAIRPQDQIF